MKCTSCGAPNANNAKFCTNCGTTLITNQQTPYQAPSAQNLNDNLTSAYVYAGFWKRFFAHILDGIIFVLISWLLTFILLAIGMPFSVSADFSLESAMPSIIMILAWWMYYALQEGSSKQATFGKRALGIKVTDMNGQPLSFAHAAGRQLAGAVSYMTFTIGYLLAAFTGRKQALHDMIAGCVVVNKHYGDRQIQAANISPPPGMSIGAIIGVVFLVLFIPVGGIIAAIALPAYYDYTVRATVYEAYTHVGSAKHAILDYAEETGYWPQNFEQANLNTQDYRTQNYHTHIGQEGELQVRFTHPQQISGGVLELTPELTSESGYVWHCRGIDIENKHLPKQCRSD